MAVVPFGSALRIAMAAAILAPVHVLLSGNVRAEAPTEVSANYRVGFAGIEVGSFTFQSVRKGNAYTVKGEAKISALLGAVKWLGALSGSGALASSGPVPRSYSQTLVSRRKFAFKAKTKTKSVKLAFARGAVTDEELDPPRKTEGRVPVGKQHLSGVLDPAAAVVALTQVRSGDPCNMRIPVFDGHQRFDLELRGKGRERLAGSVNPGQPTEAVVCSVRFVPIAGHKIKDKENDDLARRSDIEIVLRPVDGADVMVPNEIRVPTSAGTATITLRRVDIVTTARNRIALVN